jgi:beta-1,4-mannosyl-glycoprotein beta-1,4-N-acetylglucosaminyltransferase
MFAEFKDKIIHVIDDAASARPELIEGKNENWTRENNQRNQILKGLTSATSEDTIIISDLDEIPKAELVKAHYDSDVPLVFELYHACVYLNMFGGRWLRGTRLLKRKLLTTPQQARFMHGTVIENAGWHFGYIGDEQIIISKLKAFAHTEFNRYPFNDPVFLKDRLDNGRGLFGDREFLPYILPDSILPQYVQDNMPKFEKYMFRGRDDISTIDKLTRLT